MREGMHDKLKNTVPMAGQAHTSGGGFGVAFAHCCYTDIQILLSRIDCIE